MTSSSGYLFRPPADRLEAYRAAAEARGIPLSDWLRAAAEEYLRAPVENDLAGPALTRARERAGVGVSELARALGVGRSTVHGWESGKRSPSLERRAEIARVLASPPPSGKGSRRPEALDLARIDPAIAERFLARQAAAGVEVAPEVLEALPVERR